ncbi:hypothetical protein SAMN05216338_10598 [Bradyrhizobium sp. Rc2d]|uniref:hypothetical protein n=1 Tax=Bradyrhizobium sp. Rc2d TaxID=1855321 RepID=UPI00088949AF|nr:hypothetical protein [Bradyrhizobium sp. Rc2d]SDJ66748.1 hypothetical protein SAMN05216338_10598 [Bradyrhizobium sp. Rc2d]
MSSAPLIQTGRSLALSEPKAVGAQGGIKVLGSGLNLRVLVPLIVGLGGLFGLIVNERRLGGNAMLPPSLFASRSVVGANLFTALFDGPFTVMRTLMPFLMIRDSHLPTLVAGLAFIPLQVLLTVVLPLASMLCRRFGWRLPFFASSAVVALGCAVALRVGSNATYWTHILSPILSLALGMSLVIAPLATLVPRRNRIWRQQRGLARRVALRDRPARRHPAAGRSPAALGIPHGDGWRRGRCVLATLAVFIIEPGPRVEFIPPA